MPSPPIRVVQGLAVKRFIPFELLVRRAGKSDIQDFISNTGNPIIKGIEPIVAANVWIALVLRKLQLAQVHHPRQKIFFDPDLGFN